MTQYYFALVNPEVEQLFKYEMKSKFADFKLAYSRSGFFTFKVDSSKPFNPLMARLTGKCLGKIDLKNLKSPFWAWSRDSKEFPLEEELSNISDNSWYKVGDTVRLVMKVGNNEFWLVEYELLDHHLQTPGEETFLSDIESPSRAYYKIAEATEAFSLPFQKGVRVLELGSAPGGASQFLLEQGCEVIGVDPAEMDKSILSHSNFKHLKMPFETLQPNLFKNPIDWIVSDINLPPTVIMKEVGRLLTFLKPQGLLLTLKINQEKHLDNIESILKTVKKGGFNPEVKYLPSHRKEVVLKAVRS